MEYYNKNKEEIYDEFNVTEHGHTKSQAEELLVRYGKNTLPKEESDSVFKLFITQFKNPIEIILLITVVLSLIAKEYIDAFALIFIIMIDVLMGTYQEWKARKDSQSLLNLIKVKARVIRDGKEMEIEAADVVIGDIITLESGVRISADARIISAHNLQVDESSLTGESTGIYKHEDAIDGTISLAERKNMLFAGTSIITGRAKAIVTATGINTEIGKIAFHVTNTDSEKSPLTIRIEKFSKQISFLIIIVAIITALVLLNKGFSHTEIFLSVIALAVSAMPEGLPLALTMALTIGSKKMAKNNVIVKDLNAVESLGSCTVIASDKTGTLTVNEQTAKMVWLATGENFEITGTGYNDAGDVKPLNDANIDNAKKLALLGKINNEASLVNENNKWQYFGDSIDVAFLSLALKLDISETPKIVKVIPYESASQYSAVFYEKDNKLYCTVKGSLEKVMTLSNQKDMYLKQNEEFTKNGYRVIALADGEVSDTNINNIKNLDFVGMVAFIDPIRSEAKQAILECHKAGIKAVMITGDHPLTSYSIAKELGIASSIDEIATGEDVNKYKAKGDYAFDEFVKKIKVFARVTPTDKLDIVNSYKRQGEFIAVTGDGVNDAPAIKTANIGIAMGSGTDVAKETASMIVTDDNFASIVSGVKEGRTAYNNIRKITLFLLSCGIAEVLFFLFAVGFGYPIPLLAIQLLWLNIVTDGIQDIALSFEPTEDRVMNAKPRSTKESLFSKDLIIEVVILGITISLIVFIVWKKMLDSGVNIILARSYIMMLMVFIQNLNVLNCRSEKRSIFKTPLNNSLIYITITGSIILQIVLAEIPVTAKFLGLTPVPFSNIVVIFLISLIVIVVFEIYKFVYSKLKSN